MDERESTPDSVALDQPPPPVAELTPPDSESPAPTSESGVELAGVTLGSSFADAKQVLGRVASESREATTGSPPMMYEWRYVTPEGRVGIFSDLFPQQAEDATPVTAIVLESSAVDVEPQGIVRMREQYYWELTNRFGQTTPVVTNLGRIVITKWTWQTDGLGVLLEYQEEDGSPFSTKVKVEQ